MGQSKVQEREKIKSIFLFKTEEGGKKPPKRRFLNNDRFNFLSFLNLGLPHQNPFCLKYVKTVAFVQRADYCIYIGDESNKTLHI